MSKWLKRIRGAVGIGLTWAAAWALAGPLFLSLVIGVLTGGSQFSVDLLSAVVNFAATGFLAGGVFSVLLGLAEGRRTFDEMSLRRFAGWGALAAPLPYGTFIAITGLGGLWLPGFLVMLAILALLGAGSAAGSLAVARKADEGELLQAGADVAEVGLTKEEKRELLGK